MPVLLALVGLLAAAAFWYFRMRNIGQAGTEVLDHLGKARGSLRRAKLREAASQSPIMAIDDPVIAATSLLCMLVASPHPLTPREEGAIREQAARIAEGEFLDEAIVYGRWLHRQGLDGPKAIRLLAGLLNDWLSPDQMAELGDMIDGLNRSPDIVLSAPRVDQARRRLRLPD